jgi:hypothetical protein
MSDIRNLRVTHTVALLELPMDMYMFIAEKLRDAGYDNSFDDANGVGGFPAIDMGGLALVPAASPKVEHPGLSVKTTGKSVLFLLRRALNTLEPVHQPVWANPMTDHLDDEDTVTITVSKAPKDSA